MKKIPFLLLLILFTFFSFATDYEYTPTSGKAWGLNDNWTPSGYPSALGDTALFTTSQLCSLVAGTNVSIAAMKLSASALDTLVGVGTSNILYLYATCPLTIGAGAKFYNKIQYGLLLYPYGDSVFSVASNAVYAGTGSNTIRISKPAGSTTYFPKFTYTGSGNWSINQTANAQTLICVDKINLATNQLSVTNTTAAFTFRMSDSGLVCGNFRPGCPTGCAFTCTIVWKGKNKFTNYVGSANNYNLTVDSMGSSIDSFSGDWTNGTLHNYYGQSMIVAMGSDTQSITTARKTMYDLIVSNSGATKSVAIIDTSTWNDITVCNGKVRFPLPLTGRDVNFISNDSVKLSKITATRWIAFDTLCIPKITDTVNTDSLYFASRHADSLRSVWVCSTAVFAAGAEVKYTAAAKIICLKCNGVSGAPAGLPITYPTVGPITRIKVTDTLNKPIVASTHLRTNAGCTADSLRNATAIAGLTFNTTTGAWTGTPTAAGVYIVPVTAYNNRGDSTATATDTITVIATSILKRYRKGYGYGY